MQSPFMALLTVAQGPSVVIETVFENRFMHVGEFNRMGANIKKRAAALPVFYASYIIYISFIYYTGIPDL